LVYAGQFDDAFAAYERGEYATAFRLMKPLAEKGDAKAQHNLGIMYDYARGTPQDYVKALKWYRRAAGQGISEAQHNLGLMYYHGQGVPKNYVMAHMWYKLAASRFPASEGEKREMALKNRETVASLMTSAQIA
jgi:TPR repeat protein